MKHIKTTLKIFFLSLGLFFVFAGSAHAEVIKSFDSQVTVNKDASVSVVETIVYDSEGLEKHGIYRDITPNNAKGEAMKIQDISVVDTSGVAYQWQQQRNNGDVRLKIGDHDMTFSGEKTYVIRYTATNAISFYDDYDEIYWNTTGNNWPFGIDQAVAVVSLPDGTTVLQQSCYEGTKGASNPCTIRGELFSATRALNASEGLTVAVGFPKGVVDIVKPTWWQVYRIQIIAIGIPILLFCVLFFRWRKYGRDPKGSSVIVPQYGVPDQLTPMEVALIIYERPKTKDISAELIYLAIKGYVKITQTDTVLLGFIHNKGYNLTLLKDIETLENEVDKKLLRNIFGRSVGKTVSIASLTDKFYKHIPLLFKTLKKTMLMKEYYSYIPGVSILQKVSSFAQKYLLKVIITGIVFGVLHLVIIVPVSFMNGSFKVTTGWILFISFISSVGMIAVFHRLMPAKTPKGVATKEYILGLKHYLQIAEKDRLNFHNAPEKKPELFEHLLPYAIVLGVEKAWAKEFESIYTAPPSWYESTYRGGFSPIFFTTSLSNFSTAIASSLGSTPSSGGSGSGGGGFSGGGGGGGGGGSW